MNGQRIPVRWRFFAVLFLLSFLSYLMRQNIHVAGELMMPELQLSELEMGWIFASFIWGYALFQLPGGIAGIRFGPRRTLTAVGILGIVASGLTGLLPGLAFKSTAGVIATLLLIRFILGAAHAPMYPVQAAAIERWFPMGQWALPSAVSSTGLTLGGRRRATHCCLRHGVLGMACLFLRLHSVGTWTVWLMVVVCPG